MHKSESVQKKKNNNKKTKTNWKKYIYMCIYVCIICRNNEPV